MHTVVVYNVHCTITVHFSIAVCVMVLGQFFISLTVVFLFHIFKGCSTLFFTWSLDFYLCRTFAESFLFLFLCNTTPSYIWILSSLPMTFLDTAEPNQPDFIMNLFCFLCFFLDRCINLNIHIIIHIVVMSFNFNFLSFELQSSNLLTNRKYRMVPTFPKAEAIPQSLSCHRYPCLLSPGD